MNVLLNQVGAAVQQVKAKYPDPAAVGSRVSNEVIVAHQNTQVIAWRAQADYMAQLAQQNTQAGATDVAGALTEWAVAVNARSVEQEHRMNSPEFQEWLTGRQEWLAECETV